MTRRPLAPFKLVYVLCIFPQNKKFECPPRWRPFTELSFPSGNQTFEPPFQSTNQRNGELALFFTNLFNLLN